MNKSPLSSPTYTALNGGTIPPTKLQNIPNLKHYSYYRVKVLKTGISFQNSLYLECKMSVVQLTSV